MIFDTHAHYDDQQFDVDRHEILTSMRDNNVGTIINVGSTLEGCRKSVEISSQYDFIYVAIGVHPDEVGDLDEEFMTWMKETAQNNDKVVAIGEIGLDYHWDVRPREEQKYWFMRQMELSYELGLPFAVHSREAAKDTFDLVSEFERRIKTGEIGGFSGDFKEKTAGNDGLSNEMDKPVNKSRELLGTVDKKYDRIDGHKGVIHCFSYSAEMAQEYVKMGYHIGLGGVVTFKNAKKAKEVAAQVPIERILLETDCPYMAPTPFRGKRNNSTYIDYVAAEIAAIKGMSKEEVIAVTEANARKLFKIG